MFKQEYYNGLKKFFQGVQNNHIDSEQQNILIEVINAYESRPYVRITAYTTGDKELVDKTAKNTVEKRKFNNVGHIIEGDLPENGETNAQLLVRTSGQNGEGVSNLEREFWSAFAESHGFKYVYYKI